MIVIVPRGRGGACSALPKGDVDPGETPEQTAAREVREETGVNVDAAASALGEVATSTGATAGAIVKTVHFYLCDYVERVDTDDHDHEVEDARWMPLEEARRGAQLPRRARDGRAGAVRSLRGDRIGCRRVQVLNFYSTVFADQMKRGRKTATIRLGDKRHKYRKNQVVLVTVGYQYSPREKIFHAVIDNVEVKRVQGPLPARHRARQPRVPPHRGARPLPRADLRPRGRRWRTP